jgi:hypothetical protein
MSWSWPAEHPTSGTPDMTKSSLAWQVCEAEKAKRPANVWTGRKKSLNQKALDQLP